MKLFDLFKKSDRRTAKRKAGDRGEELAVKYLESKGYLILDRNWTHGKNEIDIIAAINEYVVFVEVKTTTSDKAEDFKLPAEAVDRAKRQRLTQCAREYVIHRKRIIRPIEYSDVYRFDVIEVYLNRETPEINHIQDAFFAEKGNRKQWKI